MYKKRIFLYSVPNGGIALIPIEWARPNVFHNTLEGQLIKTLEIWQEPERIVVGSSR